MKKIILWVTSLIALCVISGCNSKKGQSAEAGGSDIISEDSIAPQGSDGISDSLKAELERVGIEDLDGAIEVFFTEVYNERLYEEYGFVQRFCTENLQKKLKEEYDYDDEGEGYATWKFRSEAQDGTDEYELLKFVPEGNGWYRYDFVDMGKHGSHRIKFMTHVNPRDQVEFYIDDLE